eukprot:m.39310 g.39310  ORF g.39310 m.39310 type:complete len:50 (-) comp18168_c0_seq1:136-285(-)
MISEVLPIIPVHPSFHKHECNTHNPNVLKRTHNKKITTYKCSPFSTSFK